MTKPARAASKTVLAVEDDQAIRELLEHNLSREGYTVESAEDGRQGLQLARTKLPDLIILDLMLPEMNGVEVCRELRADRATREIPVLMLTARSEESDQLIGFSVGADDFVTKPFSVKVLLERVRVLLSRRPAATEHETIRLHGLELDRFAHEVRRDDQALPLTPTEYRLLEALMRQPGRAFSRPDLLDQAIGEDTIVLERTIDVHIRSLRAKLGDLERIIETVRGVGYRLARE
jgi:two-component system phosphate regulon response regulator PhoB